MTTDEEKISSLYQQSKNEMPPAQLDNAIIKAAHEAIEKPAKNRHHPVKSPFSGAWPAAASIAAVLVVTVILVPLIKQETPPETAPGIIDKNMDLMMEQELKQGQELKQEQDAESAPLKMKKRSLAKEKAAQQKPRPQKSLQTPQFAAEEAVAPVHTEVAAPSDQQAKPASATAGRSRLNQYQALPDNELQPGTYSLNADMEDTELTADAWLKQIQQLIEKNQLELARNELDRFKQHYPDKKIDPSILNSLNSLP